MKDLLLVAAGGALGSAGRWLLAITIDTRLALLWPGFPWGTLVVNALGCLAIGILAGWSDQPWVRLFLMVGILGGFTTFSSFALQSTQLVGAGAHMQALVYVMGSVVACLLAVWLGQLLSLWTSQFLSG